MNTPQVGLVLLSAVLYALTLPPFGWFPLLGVALVPLFAALADSPPGRAAALGALWGVGFAIGVAWWLPGMLVGYFGASWAAGGIGLVAAGALLVAPYSSAFAAWFALCARGSRRGPGLLRLAFGWCAFEFLRANPAAGTHWALSAYSLLSLDPLVQIAELAGPYGLSVLVGGANAAAAAALVPRLRGARPALGVSGIALLWALGWAYGAARLAHPLETGSTLRVAVVQAAVARPLWGDRVHRIENLAPYLRMSEQAIAAQDVDLLFWPEYAVDFYLQDPSRYQATVLALSRRFAGDLIVGGPYSPDPLASISGSPPRYHNSVFVVRQGRLAARHDKVRLVPFGETALLRIFATDVSRSYVAGAALEVLPTPRATLGALVCFEAMYPDLARELVREGAGLLVNPSNDYWFGHVAPARHQLDIARLRAIETRRWLVRPTSTGFSALVDPRGRVRAQSGFGGAALVRGEVEALRAITPYVRWGDAFAWAAVAICLTGLLRRH